jgi:hypothetical protein
LKVKNERTMKYLSACVMVLALILTALKGLAQFPDSPLPINIGMFEGVIKQGYQRCDMVYQVDGGEFPAGFILFENGLPVQCELTADQFGFASIMYYEWDENHQLISESGTTWMPDDPENSTVNYNFQFVFDDGMLVSKSLNNDAGNSYSWFYPDPGKNGIIKGYMGEVGEMELISETELTLDAKTNLVTSQRYYELFAGKALIYKASYEYDKKANLVAVTYFQSDEKASNKTTYEYDVNGVLTKRIYYDMENDYQEIVLYRWS